MVNTFIVGAVIGFTQLVKSLFDRDYRTVVIIAGSAVIGGLAGFFHIEGIDIASGIVAGLAASGVVTLAVGVGSGRVSKVD
jgi:hypothetical protein